MKVFIAGAKDIRTLDVNAKKRIESICSKEYDILVGDCYGVDSAVQKLCADASYQHVTVYASNGKPRNNIGHWPVKSIPVPSSVRGFDFYRQKDVAMSIDADCGYMIWDGKSKGTLSNIISLVSNDKCTVVYLDPIAKTICLQSQEDLLRLISACPTETQILFDRLEAKFLSRN